jgi:glycosyltransferase involved in cell wall biosynthesis
MHIRFSVQGRATRPNLRVTIGVCVRNAERTIKEAIECVMEQDFPHELMELIVVAGCSRDKTLLIVKDCLDKANMKSKIFFENKGLGHARQIVVDNARGDYIVWVDGDMVLSKDFVRKQVEFMEENPDVGIAKGKYEMRPGPNLLATLEIYSRAAAKLGDYRREKARSKSLGTSGCIYRVKAIRQAGGFDKTIKGYGEDWDAEYRTREAGWSLCTCPVPYQDYERLGLSWKELWRRYWKRGYDMHDVLEKHKGVIKVYAMLPPLAFLAGLFNSFPVYRLTRKKFAFLLPFFYALKMVFWWCGFIRRHLESKSNLGNVGEPLTKSIYNGKT